ncbi:MAG: FAD-dependent thymidylate synthase, partial [Oscillospiraceae bacterium]|nr:FAD-dependent thymidylate synthase [Oscillospiraceae bacterium]
MKVILIAHTPTPEEIVAAAAKTCYSARPIETVMENLDGESAASFVEMLSSIGHESPIEHATFTFAVEGVSRTLLAQITRHRIASFSVRSQRYVSERKFDYVLPPQIAEDEEAKALYDEIIEREREAYNKITKILLDKKLASLSE